MSYTIDQNRARFGLPPLTDEEIEQVRANPPKIGSAVKPRAVWCMDMAKAPRDRRILVQAAPTRGVYVAHWVQHPETGDEAWLIAEANDGTQLLCKPLGWAEIPAGLLP